MTCGSFLIAGAAGSAGLAAAPGAADAPTRDTARIAGISSKSKGFYQSPPVPAEAAAQAGTGFA